MDRGERPQVVKITIWPCAWENQALVKFAKVIFQWGKLQALGRTKIACWQLIVHHFSGGRIHRYKLPLC